MVISPSVWRGVRFVSLKSPIQEGSSTEECESHLSFFKSSSRPGSPQMWQANCQVGKTIKQDSSYKAKPVDLEPLPQFHNNVFLNIKAWTVIL